jgi:acyl-CoA thioesterase
MSDFAKATSVSGSAGRYSATLDGDFCVWSPAGGYLMMLALRAAGAEASFPTPLSLACHFLSAPKLSEVALQVVSLRKSRVAESLRVCMLQDDRPVLEMLVWAGEPLPGYAHQDAHMPQVPSWQDLPAHAYQGARRPARGRHRRRRHQRAHRRARSRGARRHAPVLSAV